MVKLYPWVLHLLSAEVVSKVKVVQHAVVCDCHSCAGEGRTGGTVQMWLRE